MSPNLQRLIQLANEVFDVRNDPSQLDVNPTVMDELYRIHPSTISQYEDENGPAAWLLLIPTSNSLMNDFLEDKINEKELFDATKSGVSFETVYLCSALVLPEYRRKGILKNLFQKAFDEIAREHSIQALFVWAFSQEGLVTARNLAKEFKLPLYEKLH